MDTWDESLLSTIGQYTGRAAVMRKGMVTVSSQDASISTFKLVAVFESEHDAEMFLDVMVPKAQRWRYRVTTERTVILL